MNTLVEKLCSLLCALALFAIMTLTFFDVGGRKLMSRSITGSLELTELLMVVVIFASLPLVSRRGEHVVFDSLDSIWPAWFLRLQGVLVNLLCGSLMRVLCGVTGLVHLAQIVRPPEALQEGEGAAL